MWKRKRLKNNRFHIPGAMRCSRKTMACDGSQVNCFFVNLIHVLLTMVNKKHYLSHNSFESILNLLFSYFPLYLIMSLSNIYLLFNYAFLFECNTNNWLTEKCGEIIFEDDN